MSDFVTGVSEVKASPSPLADVFHPKNAYPALVTSGKLAIVLPDSTRIQSVLEASLNFPSFASKVTSQ